MKLIVTGSMSVLFEKHEMEVHADAGPVKVPAFRCRWCGWTVVTDKRGALPDHECSGPTA
ncbi:MAG TPA: hypothetical protein VE618_11725 [Myxococcaceae bacterium]|nr:hypothetical protein [Myxococcaceae bacterium]